MFDIKVSNKAKKFVQKQDTPTRKRIKNALLQLAEYPYNRKENDIKKMKGYSDTFRLRVGGIRMIYKVEDEKVILYVLDIDFRGNIYK
ncbi:type II toxin-antitoxin system RelE family toxin [Desertibacillus haloalkaliphilus]|uniref:type II toxin-antitoxin system RelE family toxin n=1 Tax=Desertibacillus haloalkaliphilus TaxID=1328930 RepID=UPI001C273111|nr:type II toxin-antitoxin system RelE/ParE family toxin [Desertibacillus haloalkaliphilus]MBU8907483.1 type II toxin-antitoxin system RelE/ParE family toxin [Desertibacillus haloalkaliphilus]